MSHSSFSTASYASFCFFQHHYQLISVTTQLSRDGHIIMFIVTFDPHKTLAITATTILHKKKRRLGHYLFIKQ